MYLLLFLQEVQVEERKVLYPKETRNLFRVSWKMCQAQHDLHSSSTLLLSRFCDLFLHAVVIYEL